MERISKVKVLLTKKFATKFAKYKMDLLEINFSYRTQNNN